MPWLMNCGRTAESVTLADGTSKVFPAKTRVYVPLSAMSVALGMRVQQRKFLSFGGDPPMVAKAVAETPAEPAAPLPAPQMETKSDTSSVHHQEHVTLPRSPEEIPATTPQEQVEEEQQEVFEAAFEVVEEVVETVAVATVDAEAGPLLSEGPNANQGIGGYRGKRHRRRNPV